ncbi:hypothetical protein [Aureimonas sp. AU4]|uniref:hypothetical protein n=1 Tax=Aureimonas sp. AU4 TaxID=1638163 RepID=UPI000783D88A|nr:hypothetical protein [Aureimonas sp. AU4]
MNLSEAEQAFLRGMRAITLDAEGREIFVGLTAEESEEYLDLSRRNEHGEAMSANPRYLELHGRHEAERERIVAGEAPLDRAP